MRLTPKVRLAVCVAAIPLAVTAWIVGAGMNNGREVHAGQDAQNSRTIELGPGRKEASYAVTVSVKDPAQLQGEDAVHVVLSDAQGEVESKWLHTADLDFYLTLHPRAAGPVKVSLSGAAGVRIPEISATMKRDMCAIRLAVSVRSRLSGLGK